MRVSLRNVLTSALLGALTAIVMSAALLTAHAQAAAVGIDNFTFNPERITVKAGTTVTWTNKDDIPHTVTASGHAFRSKALDTDDSYAFTFTTPGIYEYFCSLHPHMVGTIVVESAGGGAH
jgi:plastocyanin